MNKQSKALSYLGLAMRAGKLAFGDEGVLGAVRSGQARLVVLAEDASANTRKKFQDKCRHYNVELFECFNRYELGGAIGKEARVLVAVLDSGFAQLIRPCLVKPPEVEPIE
ncbi:L7Ae/L30e/S12e/Gadd45 family ribosomal protein [Paenibacillus ginsengarvi]|uniref:50S ribosomal protein L7ae n=1 Tax=Paenibacillus ginsengarvi TaxID=400777 RepID=A0A3B0CTP4_9BACL|nr:ribosomal L7Ae/L30e/S12e/Gadd45 family protein [Paenibacillus ginsengarvi]RKN86479.1 50S ribosomal protein L7ae [Paenibacillus ginsengarvi]